MTREIKFRVWDTVEKVMYIDHLYIKRLKGHLFFSLEGDMTCYREDIRGGDDCLGDLDIGYCPSDFIVMQYTGLQDKNGKEIYEGDVVELPSYMMGKKYGTFLKKVEFKDGVFGIREEALFTPLIDTEESDLDSKRRIPNYGVVYDRTFPQANIIGNIYENPEL